MHCEYWFQPWPFWNSPFWLSHRFLCAPFLSLFSYCMLQSPFGIFLTQNLMIDFSVFKKAHVRERLIDVHLLSRPVVKLFTSTSLPFQLVQDKKILTFFNFLKHFTFFTIHPHLSAWWGFSKSWPSLFHSLSWLLSRLESHGWMKPGLSSPLFPPFMFWWDSSFGDRVLQFVNAWIWQILWNRQKIGNSWPQ